MTRRQAAQGWEGGVRMDVERVRVCVGGGGGPKARRHQLAVVLLPGIHLVGMGGLVTSVEWLPSGCPYSMHEADITGGCLRS